MKKEVSSIGYVDCTPPVQEKAAKDVFDLLKKNFYFPERIQEMTSVEATIATARDAPYTAMVPKYGLGSNERLTSTVLCDTGLRVRQEEAGFRIIGIRNDSSALYSEIMIGDLIVDANNVPMNKNNMSASTTQWFREITTGTKGTIIPIYIKKKGGVRKVMTTLTSPRRYAEVVETDRDDICAVRIERFTAKTYDDVSKALRSRNPWNMRGVILDMRGNGGGNLQSAVDVASLFLGKDKEVASEVQREGKVAHTTNQDAHFDNLAIGMLVDRQSASASEVLVGSLKHYKHALVAGHTTFGKGSVQREFEVPSVPNKRLKMTTSKWLTPEGQSVDGEGFKPHIYVQDVRLSCREKIDGALQIALEELAHELPKRNSKKQRYRSQY